MTEPVQRSEPRAAPHMPCLRCIGAGKSHYDQADDSWQIQCQRSGCHFSSPIYDSEAQAWEWWDWRS